APGRRDHRGGPRTRAGDPSRRRGLRRRHPQHPRGQPHEVHRRGAARPRPACRPRRGRSPLKASSPPSLPFVAMAQRTDIFDLGRLSLHSGEGRRIDTYVTVDPLSFGDQTYEAGTHEVPVRLDVSRTIGGYALRLRFDVRLDGPCMRCLDPAQRTIDVDAREVDQPGAGDDDQLTSPYVDRDKLDLRA